MIGLVYSVRVHKHSSSGHSDSSQQMNTQHSSLRHTQYGRPPAPPPATNETMFCNLINFVVLTNEKPFAWRHPSTLDKRWRAGL